MPQVIQGGSGFLLGAHFSRQYLWGGGVRHPWKSKLQLHTSVQSQKDLQIKLPPKASSQHLKEPALPNTTVCSTIGILTALLTPLNFQQGKISPPSTKTKFSHEETFFE